MAESPSSQNLPSTSRQPSQNLPSTSGQPSQNLPSTSGQLFQNLPSTSRQPSQNLPSTSRQPSQEICLETHKWHAKRFHMINKWGYKIPHYSNDDSSISYRAITEDCLLQDISYYICIEIVGRKNLLEATLKKHCNPTKTFAEKMYTNGQKEGTVMFFKKNGYPQFPIGNVNFFWKLNETKIKTIWMWVHPSFYSDFLSEIISSFKFKRNNAKQDRADISHNLTDLYTNDAGCNMRILKDALNRFRLSGPSALTVLKESLRVPSLTELDLDLENCSMTEEQDSSLSYEKIDTSTDSNVSVLLVEKMVIDGNETDTDDSTIHDLKEKMWHTRYYKERANIEAFKIQELMWQLMKVLGSPSFLLSNMIIGLTVLDPRSYLPVRRRKTEIPSSAGNLRSQLPSDLSRSPIWDAQIRQIVSSSCVSTKTIDKRKPGTSDAPYLNKDTLAKIPILLIQKPAVASLDLGSRIDIIIPSGWAKAFWNVLKRQSPLVGGLREIELIVFESLETRVPDINDPDTPAYTREALTRKEQLIIQYFSYSPIRRINFMESGIHNPVVCDWKSLIKSWSDVEDFYVLRHCRLLALLREEFKTIERRNAGCVSTVQESVFDFQEFDEYQNCLVQVQLYLVDKRMPIEFTIICMPTLKDFKKFKYYQDFVEPANICHLDPNEESRKIFRRLHFVDLEQLNQHRVKRKKTSRDNVLPEEFDVVHDENNGGKDSKHQKMMSDHAKKMRKLYVPGSTEVHHSCDRKVMGYVTMGGYSSLRFKLIGIGYVALPSLLEIIRMKSNVVLVRDIKSIRLRKYRYARLEILVDINDKY